MTAPTSKTSTFRVAMIQMRAGRAPHANVDKAAALIGEARRGGADYVLTPEMTNVMEVHREALFGSIVAEDDDASLATFRELARTLGIYVHVGSLAVRVSPDKAANRSFLTVPSAFTKQTGEAHWHVLLRSRAIENGCFVFAAAQGGKHENGRETFGHSLVIDPWGRILAEAATEPGVVFADVDPAEVAA